MWQTREAPAVASSGYIAPDADVTPLDAGLYEADPATVSSFRLDKYLVTVGRFRQFVSAWKSGWAPAPGSGKHTQLNGGRGLEDSNNPGTYETGWQSPWGASESASGNAYGSTPYVGPTDDNLLNCYPNPVTWTRAPGSQENLPINCVNWYEAYAFCIWDGGFLPSAAEWQYAAEGGSQQREYPWGSTTPGTACPGAGCAYAISNCNYPAGGGNCGAGSSGLDIGSPVNIAPVGATTLGAGRWGQMDLAGEFREWNVEWVGPFVNPCVDCAALTLTPGGVPQRLVPGSAYWNAAGTYGDVAGSQAPPSYRYPEAGIRCARTP
jgi:formylglycine-generating enzyme required for sulfatase activity